MKTPLRTFRLILLTVIGLSTSTFPAFAQMASTVLSFQSVAELRAHNTAAFGATAPHALTGGYYVGGDGGGNKFIWSGNSTAADNGGTVIKPTAVPSGSPGRWLATITSTFNVKTFGAKGDGVTDDTAAINTALSAATGAQLYFPAGHYLTTGGHNLTGRDRTRITGAGAGSTTFRLAHASNDLFYTTADVRDLDLSNFTVVSDTVTRTGGWVFRVNVPYNQSGQLLNSSIHDVRIRNQVNGIWMAKYGIVTLRDIVGWQWVGTGGIGIKAGQTTSTDVNQGIGLNVDNCYIYGSDGADVGAGQHTLDYAFVIEDTDAVYIRAESGQTLQSNLLIRSNPGGHAASNNFFDRAIFDGGTGQCVRVTGAGWVSRTKFVGCWFASAQGGNSFLPGFQVDSGGFDSYEISACNFVNLRGRALSLNPGVLGAGTVSNNTFTAYGTSQTAVDAIYVNSPLNGLGPVITGNNIGGGHGVALRTSSTSNRIVVAANAFAGGVALGTPPFVLMGNSEITNAVPESDITGTSWTAYTPSLSAGSGSIASATTSGAFKKIGKTVSFRAVAQIINNGTAGAYIELGLPFAAATDSLSFAGVDRGLTGKALAIQAQPGGSSVVVRFYDVTYPGANGATLVINGTYESVP